jgi:hypothetical protein
MDFFFIIILKYQIFSKNMVFKKRQTNQNKTIHPGRKRKIIATIALSLSLLFGKARLSSSQSSSLNFDNKVVQERIIDDQEFCSFKENDQQVILAKTGDSAPSVPTSTGRGQPSNFPSPPSGGRPSQPSRPVYVSKYRTAPKVVPGLGAGGNPAGAGNGGRASEFEDQCPVPENQKSQESKTYDYQSKKKKQSAEQCDLDENVKDAKVEIVYRIRENPALARETERAGRDQDSQRSINNLVEQLSLGNRNPGIGTENVFKDVYELRGKNRARVYYREVGGKIEILAKSVKSNQQKVINILKKMYN